MNIAPVDEKRAVITGSFAEFKTVKNRSVGQIIIEVPIEATNEALMRLGGLPMPGKEPPVAVALLNSKVLEKEQAQPPNSPSLAQQAGAYCASQAFQEFLSERLQREITNEQQAASAVHEVCEIASHRELNESDAAARAWKALRGEFQAWKIAG